MSPRVRHFRKMAPQGLDDREAARLLALLEDESTEVLTIEDMRARGIQAPAQAIYTLQLRGYQVDRVAVQHASGHQLIGYRLRAAEQQASDEAHPAPQ
ncbi:MAG: hypothetical protein JOZ73_10935 [Solirubrobacterales bacterium]|nr:hypothetical protein [Solirubrobacterales bacterium]